MAKFFTSRPAAFLAIVISLTSLQISSAEIGREVAARFRVELFSKISSAKASWVRWSTARQFNFVNDKVCVVTSHENLSLGLIFQQKSISSTVVYFFSFLFDSSLPRSGIATTAHMA